MQATRTAVSSQLRRGALGRTRLRQSAAVRRTQHFAAWRPTAIQRRMLESTASRKLFRGPNQVGKTEAMAADVVDCMLGTGRWQRDRARRHPPPVEIWVVCSSWKQSLVVQRKIHRMVPVDALSLKSKFSRKRGFTGQSFELRNGSLCTIVTIKQDTDELASATLDAIFVDEVPTEEAWGELVARVRHKGGQISMYFTPINRPVEWIKAKVAEGEVAEFHTGLTLAAVTPEGALRPFQTQAQIDEFRRDVPPWQRAQRVDGSWDGASEGRWFQDFKPDEHVSAAMPWDPHPPTRAILGEREFTHRAQNCEWRVAVGFDYGLRPGKMVALLVLCREGASTMPEICYLDEEVAGDKQTWSMPELVARTLAMLKRNGLDYDDVDEWRGDRSAQGKGGKITNQDMRAHFAAALGRQWSDTKHIAQPSKPQGSVAYGCGLMNSAFARAFAWVNPRCKRLIEFFSHFQGDEHYKAKDAGDGGRYAFLGLVTPSAWYRLAA